VTYAHPLLEPVLRKTYGVMVYQEDVMAVTQALAGFTLSQADVLCFAIRKKIREKLDAQKMKFVEGCLRNGVHADVIEQVWKNVGEGAVEGIIEARSAGGRFKSLDDFCGRIDLQRCNKRVLESLIKCGALDAFGPRAVQLAHLDLALATAQREQRDRESGQVG